MSKIERVGLSATSIPVQRPSAKSASALARRPKIIRLKRRADFLAVAAANRKWVASCLVAQVLLPRSAPDDSARAGCAGTDDTVPAMQSKPEKSEDCLRLGFTASRKVGNAVARNRAKRRLKAAVADVMVGARTRPADLVLIARKSTVTCEYSALKNELRQGLVKLGVIAP